MRGLPNEALQPTSARSKEPLRLSGLPAYSEKYLVGSQVRIIERATLEQFRSEWRLHNPLREEQLVWAGQPAVVSSVGFYHGGDPLYELDGVPGVWHEPCLSPID